MEVSDSVQRLRNGNGVTATDIIVETDTADSQQPFRVDVSSIPQAESKDADVLTDLRLQIFNQEDLEAGVVAQAEKCLEEQALSKQKKRPIKDFSIQGNSSPKKVTTNASASSGVSRSGPAKTSNPYSAISAIERYLADQAKQNTRKLSKPSQIPTKRTSVVHTSSVQNNGTEIRELSNKQNMSGQVFNHRKRRKNDAESEEEKEMEECDCSSVNSSEVGESGVTRQSRRITKDDANSKVYFERLKNYEESEAERKRDPDFSDEDMELSDGLKITRPVWSELYPYQRAGVRWLWELHRQEVGGILGDEMGLGKTIQMIAFLSGLYHSRLWDSSQNVSGLGPCLVVCPATVLHQWVNEFHRWCPPLRVAILHASGSHSGSKSSLVNVMQKAKGIVLTTYQGLLGCQDILLREKWHYIILDEGHKIRNPDSQITIACKQFRTPHRLILSGSPMQNNLKELWSLFDFVFPGKLGLMNVFLEQFSVPIIQGSREMASDIQVQTAFKCATMLKNLINPYLLRRSKTDVKTSIQLPQKDEQVLFCQLTDHQRKSYEEYLNSDEIKNVVHGNVQLFVGLMNLRKLCNHPDLLDGGPKSFIDIRTHKPTEMEHDEQRFGYWRRSGKMIVVEALLKIWYSQQHKVLLFSQSKKLLDIMEKFVLSYKYSYLRMDGETEIGKRQELIRSFNENPEVFLFLLTTKVGGLGVNLTGANRVIIFDPDWNPSTDTQARERAWRIGQTKNVTIYRLLCAGTIEEKIYHRQIFKQYLTNRVLKDPKQKRFFKHNDLRELFSLSPPEKHEVTETGASFGGTLSHKGESAKSKSDRSVESKERLRLMAKAISKKIATGKESGKEIAGLVRQAIEPHAKKSQDFLVGEKIDFLAKQELYQSPMESEEVPIHNDQFILKKLFKRTTAHSAIPFEDVANGSNEDYAIVEKEAEKVAQEAMRVLRESRKACYDAASGIPNQDVAAPVHITRREIENDTDGTDNPPSAALLLCHIRKASVRVNDHASTSSDGQENGQPKDYVNFGDAARLDQNLCTFASPESLSLARQMVTFLNLEAEIPGQASTETMVEKFRTRLPDDASTLFRALLRGICSFEKSSGGIGLWKLKEEYRQYF